jgi:hypothetical protein
MAPPAVFGREDELAVADTFLESALEGFSMLRLEGEAGTGKTTAWRELVRRAEGRGFRVLTCRPAQAETKLAGSALADLLEPVSAAELEALPAPQRRALDIALLRAEPGDRPLDQRPIAAAVLGTVEGGRGRLRFQTAPGRGRSSIEARFELNGIPAETKTVARFRPASPRLGTPRRLRVRRRGERLAVSWRAVPEATRYRVVAASAGGLQRSRLVRGRSAKLGGIPATNGGRVTVQALDSLRRGRPAHARFERTANRSTRFGKLGRCRTAGSRIACRGRSRS